MVVQAHSIYGPYYMPPRLGSSFTVERWYVFSVDPMDPDINNTHKIAVDAASCRAGKPKPGIFVVELTTLRTYSHQVWRVVGR